MMFGKYIFQDFPTMIEQGQGIDVDIDVDICVDVVGDVGDDLFNGSR